MKVAFATQDNVHINAHFGWAKKVDIYDVSVDGYKFIMKGRGQEAEGRRKF
jgi:nitrogen fixation protein NifX